MPVPTENPFASPAKAQISAIKPPSPVGLPKTPQAKTPAITQQQPAMQQSQPAPQPNPRLLAAQQMFPPNQWLTSTGGHRGLSPAQWEQVDLQMRSRPPQQPAHMQPGQAAPGRAGLMMQQQARTQGPPQGPHQSFPEWQMAQQELQARAQDPQIAQLAQQMGVDPLQAAQAMTASEHLGVGGTDPVDAAELYNRYYQMSPEMQSAFQQWQDYATNEWHRPGSAEGGQFPMQGMPQRVDVPQSPSAMWGPDGQPQLLSPDQYPGLDNLAERYHMSLNDPRLQQYWSGLQSDIAAGNKSFVPPDAAMRGFKGEQAYQQSVVNQPSYNELFDQFYAGHRRIDPSTGQDVITTDTETPRMVLNPAVQAWREQQQAGLNPTPLPANTPTEIQQQQVGQNAIGLPGALADMASGVFAMPAGIGEWAETGNSDLLSRAVRSGLSPINHLMGADFGHDLSIPAGQSTTPTYGGQTYDPLTGQNVAGTLPQYAFDKRQEAADPSLSPLERGLATFQSGAASAFPDIALAALAPSMIPRGGLAGSGIPAGIGLPQSLTGMARGGAGVQGIASIADPNKPPGWDLLSPLRDAAGGYMAPYTPQFSAARGAFQAMPGSDKYYEAADSLRNAPGENAPGWQRGLAEAGATTMDILPEFLLAGGGAAGLKNLRQHGLGGLAQLPGQAMSTLRPSSIPALLKNPSTQLAAGMGTAAGIQESMRNPQQQSQQPQQPGQELAQGIEQDLASGAVVPAEQIEQLRADDPERAAQLETARTASPLTGAIASAQDFLTKAPERAMALAQELETNITAGPLSSDTGRTLAEETLTTGQIPADVQAGAGAKLEEAGYDAGSIQKILGELSPTQHLLLWGGLGLGAIGLISAIAGEGGLGSWLMALLGIGAAAATGAHAGLLGEGAQEFTQNAMKPGNYMDYIPDSLISGYLQSQGPDSQLIQDLENYDYNRGGLFDSMGLVDSEVAPKLEQYGMTREQLDRIADLWKQQQTQPAA